MDDYSRSAKGAKRRNPNVRYCIHDRSERQQCAKCNAMNRRCEFKDERGLQCQRLHHEYGAHKV